MLLYSFNYYEAYSWSSILELFGFVLYQLRIIHKSFPYGFLLYVFKFYLFVHLDIGHNWYLSSSNFMVFPNSIYWIIPFPHWFEMLPWMLYIEFLQVLGSISWVSVLPLDLWALSGDTVSHLCVWFSLLSLGTITPIFAWEAVDAWRTTGNHRAGLLDILTVLCFCVCTRCFHHNQEKRRK